VITGLAELSLLAGAELGGTELGGTNEDGGAIVGGTIVACCVVDGNRLGPVRLISPPVGCPLVLAAQPLANATVTDSAASSRRATHALPTRRNAKGSPSICAPSSFSA
jgi:hypothetical protein